MRMLQIRDVPEDLHERLKVRAAREHMSMSSWVLREIELSLTRPSMSEWLRELESRPAQDLGSLPEDMIRADREAR